MDSNTSQLDGLDQKVVSGAILSVQGGPTDITAKFNTDVAAPINGQETSVVVIPLEPVTQFVTTPDGDQIDLPVTSYTSDSTEMTLDTDEYVKLPVRRLAVKETTTLQRLGTSIGKALVRLGNSRLVKAIVAGAGKRTYLGGTVAATSAQAIWSKLNAEAAQLSEDGFDLSEFELVIKATTFQKLNDDIANLRGSNDALAAAAAKLGVGGVTYAKFEDLVDGADTHKVVAAFVHRNAVAVAKRLDPTRVREGDKSNYILTRVMLGAKVLAPEAVVTIQEGTAPAA